MRTFSHAASQLGRGSSSLESLASRRARELDCGGAATGGFSPKP